MSYTPTTWNTGDEITASKMNKLENGVANASGINLIDGVVYRMNNTANILGDFESALSKARQGLPVIVVEVFIESGTGWTSFNPPNYFMVNFETNYPNRLNIVITGGVGWHWTADGLEYYD